MADLTYSVGTVSVVAGGTLVTGSGVLWTGVNARQWDMIQIDPDNSNIILPITALDGDGGTLAIPAWKGGPKTGVPYIIYQLSPLRFLGGQAMADVDQMLAYLNTEGWYRYVNPIYAGPTEQGIVANEGQFALKYTTGQLWIMTGGVWVLVGTFKGFNPLGAYNPATAYVVNDLVSYNGGSYVAMQNTTGNLPTNTTYWMVSSSPGTPGLQGPATLAPLAVWAGGQNYVSGPPASYVSVNGSSYACSVSHTSTTFAADLAGGKWIVVAAKGADGTNGTNGTNARQYGGTSATSLLIGTGAKAFTTQADLAYLNGARVRATSAANLNNWMEGIVTYNVVSGALTMTSDKVGGAGTFADWNFNLTGAVGAGDLSSANNLSDVANKTTARQNLGVAVPYPQHRLTLTSLTPVTTADVAGATAIYCTPFEGSYMPVWNGTDFVTAECAELTLPLSATYHVTTAPAIYDVFFALNAGVPFIGSGPAWSSVLTRDSGSNTTDIELYRGLWVNKKAITLRFGTAAGNTVNIPARQAVCMGSFRVVVAGQATDTATQRFLSNMYNAVPRRLRRTYGDTTWVYGGVTRAANANPNSLVEILNTVPNRLLTMGIDILILGTSGVNARGIVSVGIDIANTPSPDCITVFSVSNNGFFNRSQCTYRGYPVSQALGGTALGYHGIIWQEGGDGTNTVTWYSGPQNGMHGETYA